MNLWNFYLHEFFYCAILTDVKDYDCSFHVKVNRVASNSYGLFIMRKQKWRLL